MNPVKSIKKRLKKVVYETRGINVKSLLCIMLIGGIFFSGCYSIKYIYGEYASSRAKIDLYYDEIADAQYPDKSRFTYYDFVDVERVDKALKIMRERGHYNNFTAEELQDSFYIYSYLDSSVKDTVDYARSEGQNYSYVANEYSVAFFQPHDYKSKNIFARFFGIDRSKEFLEILMDVNYEYFVGYYGGEGGFKTLTDLGDLSKYDYDEKVAAYENRINTIIDALNNLNQSSDNFVSTSKDRTLKDVVGEYRLLKSDLKTISNFVSSSALTRDPEVTKNKLKTNIEATTLRLNKSNDLYNINQFAQNSYDHTFTENLIIVALDKEDGLYQARPKTAFDTVADQKHEAMEETAEHQSKLNDLNTSITRYDETTHSDEEYERLCRKCDELLKTFDEDYQKLCEDATETVNEYYESSNNGFMHYQVEKRQIFDMDFWERLILMFVIGAVCAFILSVLLNSYQEYKKARKRRKIADAIKQDN